MVCYAKAYTALVELNREVAQLGFFNDIAERKVIWNSVYSFSWFGIAFVTGVAGQRTREKWLWLVFARTCVQPTRANSGPRAPKAWSPNAPTPRNPPALP